MFTSIFPINSYSEKEKIQSAIRNLFDQVPWFAEWQKENFKPLVVLKPNWVQESHDLFPKIWEPVISHPEVIFETVNALIERLPQGGTICICDSPNTYSDFKKIVSTGNFEERIQAIKGRNPLIAFELLDLRREIWFCKEDVIIDRQLNKPDPRGYIRVNLKKESLFFRFSGEGRYYGADYNRREVNRHHNGTVQEYLLAGTPMKCDLFINIPKLKTHKKTGITCCLKNLVGINGDKNWLPHHTSGTPKSKGDEFPAQTFRQILEQHIKKMIQKLAFASPGLGAWILRKARNSGKKILGDSQKVVRNGNWYGNDTCWRMALDLNRALLFGNNDGSIREAGPAKNYLAIIDGIIGGEGDGPLAPDSVNSGVLITGDNPAEADAVAARLMGFHPEKLSIVREAFSSHPFPISRKSIEEVQVRDCRAGKLLLINEILPALSREFRPHFGWIGHLT